MACECPGDNEDDEVLLPVDFRTLEEHFGFGEGEQPELVDEDGRMEPGAGTMWGPWLGKAKCYIPRLNMMKCDLGGK